MPLKFHRLVLPLLLILSSILSLTACRQEASPALARMMMDEGALPAASGPDLFYSCNDGSLLYTYGDADIFRFAQQCADCEAEGYERYSSAVMGSTAAVTYVKDRAMAHVYWHATTKELNVVLSQDAGATLPPAEPTASEGSVPCTITQIMDDTNDIGMGYVVQLTDGSYIVYDGSFAEQADRIEQFLLDHHPGEGLPLVRAWVLTHSHQDHVEAFRTLAQRARQEATFTIEYVIVSPMNHAEYQLSDEDSTAYLSTELYSDVAAFTGAQVVFAHTGMTFAFGNLRMEVLYTPESLFKSTEDIYYFNNTSVVTRLYDENYSALFLGDVGELGTDLMIRCYGDSYLSSDACQIAHHGLEDVPLSFYEVVRAPLLLYPCSQRAYDQRGQNGSTRRGLQEKPYTKEILIAGLSQYTVPWGKKFEASATLSMPDYIPLDEPKDDFPNSINRPLLHINTTE